uniref:Uncharacterized protein n=1 Tax=Strongyloides stercoralis TaxID=6248 RepID=A0AAF5DJQ9_STRER
MPRITNNKYTCPLCYQYESLANDSSYTRFELVNHFKNFHGHEPGSLWKTKCKKCIEDKNRGVRNIKVNELTLSNLLKHMLIKGCFKIEEVPDITVSTLESALIDQENNDNMMEIDNSIDEINENDFSLIENELDQSDYTDDDILYYSSITEKDKPLSTFINYFFKYYNSDCGTFKNIEMFLEAQQSLALSYSDTNLPGIIEEFLKVIRSGGDKNIKYCSPFHPEEQIFENVVDPITNIATQVSINDNNKYKGVMINIETVLQQIAQTHLWIISDINDCIKLQMYADEVNMNSHTDGYSELLHVCLRINNSFEEMSKMDSVFTWAILPTHGVKQFGTKEDGSRFFQFFKKLKEEFYSHNKIKVNGKLITFEINKMLGDHKFLDCFWNVNSANGELGHIPSCRICLIPPCIYSNYKTVDDIDEVDQYRREPTKNPFFNSIDQMQYSDWFHDILEEELISSMYIIFQKLCLHTEYPEININTLSQSLLQHHKKRGNNVVQNITGILNSNIISRKLSFIESTSRKAISFYSGYGNLEAAYCLNSLLRTLLEQNPNEEILFYRNTLKNYLNLYEFCSKKSQLTEIEIERLKNVCNQVVEYALKLSHGRYGIIAWNNNSFVGLSTDCYERKHQCVKKYYKASKNHKFPALTILKKTIVKREIKEVLKKTIIGSEIKEVLRRHIGKI